MPWNWSNPEPSNQTPAAQTAGAHLQAPDIGHLVAAILRNRAQQQEQEQQGIQNMISGITKGIGGIQQSSDTSKIADYIQNYETAPDQSADLASMSPSARLKALDWTQKQDAADLAKTNEQQAGDLQGQLIASQIWKNYNGGGDSNSNTNERRDMLNEQARADAVKRQIAAAIGVPPNKVDAELGKLNSYVPGQTAFPAIGTQPQIGDATRGDYKQNVLDAAKRYHDILQQLGNPRGNSNALPSPDLPPLGGGASPIPPSPSLPQGQSAPGYGEDAKPIPGATASSVTSGMAGAGPTDDVLAQAQQAIAQGAPVAAVVQRLKDLGINADPTWFQ